MMKTRKRRHEFLLMLKTIVSRIVLVIILFAAETVFLYQSTRTALVSNGAFETKITAPKESASSLISNREAPSPAPYSNKPTEAPSNAEPSSKAAPSYEPTQKTDAKTSLKPFRSIHVTDGPNAYPSNATQARRMPNFLFAGTQKAGTTSTAAYLLRQDGVCGPQARPGTSFGKEVHFFNSVGHLAKGIQYYQSLFHHCANGEPILMDATPEYMLHAETIHKYYSEAGALGNLKIMFTLREPVARELSLYNHLLRETSKKRPPAWSKQVRDANTGAVLSFAEYAERTLIPSIAARSEASRGIYAHWLRPWFTLFDRKQIYIASYDDLTNNETDFLTRLHAFLDLPPPDRSPRKRKATLPVMSAEKARITKPIPCSACQSLRAVQRGVVWITREESWPWYGTVSF